MKEVLRLFYFKVTNDCSDRERVCNRGWRTYIVYQPHPLNFCKPYPLYPLQGEPFPLLRGSFYKRGFASLRLSLSVCSLSRRGGRDFREGLRPSHTPLVTTLLWREARRGVSPFGNYNSPFPFKGRGLGGWVTKGP